MKTPAACSRIPASCPSISEPQYIGESGGFIVGERDGVDCFVRIVDAEQCELSLARPMRDHTDAATLFGDHVMTRADSRQIDLFDRSAHSATPTGDLVASLCPGAIMPTGTTQLQIRSIRR